LVSSEIKFDKYGLGEAFCHGLRGFRDLKESEMTVHRHGRHHERGRESASFDWRRLHHSRLFWVGFFMLLLAITIYVLSDDLSWRPRLRG